MLELSKRLSIIAGLIKEGSSVCDVGTDHGYLPAFLYLSGKAKKVIATDINEKPLLSARKNLDRLGASGVKLFLCDGLADVEDQNVDTVVIAGMGGEVISGIINRARFLRDSVVTLILQPTTAANELRLFLAKNGFNVESETALAENNKIYSIMCARFDGDTYSIDDVRSVIGLLKPDNDAAISYIQKQYKIAQKCAEQLKSATNKKEEYSYYLKLSDKLEEILGG